MSSAEFRTNIIAEQQYKLSDIALKIETNGDTYTALLHTL